MGFLGLAHAAAFMGMGLVGVAHCWWLCSSGFLVAPLFPQHNGCFPVTVFMWVLSLSMTSFETGGMRHVPQLLNSMHLQNHHYVNAAEAHSLFNPEMHQKMHLGLLEPQL
jgi:hypothetical protein